MSRIALLVVVCALVTLGFVALNEPANCNGRCVQTFCGFDSDCPNGCRCFKPNDVTGFCG